jgi:hypothetical protein
MQTLENFFRTELNAMEGRIEWPEEDAGFALPSGSLRFLEECVRTLGIRRVFEYGSGASSRLFLRLGCELTSVENDRRWLTETMDGIPEPDRSRMTAYCQPLERIWCGAFPCLGWRLSATLRQKLRDADLVLVDSPAYPPFREAALMQALSEAPNILVVLDDLRIPTLRQFSERIAAQSECLLFRIIERDHHLGVFCRPEKARLINRHGVVAWVKGMRRYVLARRERH